MSGEDACIAMQTRTMESTMAVSQSIREELEMTLHSEITAGAVVVTVIQLRIQYSKSYLVLYFSPTRL